MNRRFTSLVCVTASVAVLGACGVKGPFALTAAENDPAALERVFANLEAAAAGPINKLATPIAAITTESELALVDLAGERVVWKVSASVSSRLVISRDVVVGIESGSLVARDIGSGQVSWTKSTAPDLVGLAADASSVYLTTTNGKRWTITALSASNGSERWSSSAGGVLGAPSATRGIVVVPFLNQWMAILDARTGKSLTRVRAVDEQISFSRSSGGAVFFGSKRGVYLLDVRAANGNRAQSTFGTAKTPKAFENLTFARDAYDVKQADYTAFDQRQLVWNAAREGDVLAFGGGTITAHYYRFLIGIGAGDGELRWAYSHPRYDLMATSDIGGVIVGIAKNGGWVALDSASGSLLQSGAIEGLSKVRGATFDAAGFRPAGGQAADTVGALTRIVSDKDSRFGTIKKLAVDSLAKQTTPAATSALIDVARETRGELAERAANALIARADPSGAEALTKELEGGKRCISLCARALAAIAPASIAPAVLDRARSALVRQFGSPKTSDVNLAAIALALGKLGGPGELAVLRMFFLVHRADPSVAENTEATAAIADALAASGGAGRAAVDFVAADPVSHEEIATAAKRALAK